MNLLRYRNLTLSALLLVVSITSEVDAQFVATKPTEVDGIGITEHLNDPLPLDVEFKDELGRKYPLREYFRGSKPVIISFNYSDCPKLCDAQLSGFVRTLQQITLKPDEDFHYISLSIDPSESVNRARDSRDTYVARYGDLNTKDGWHFLTGDQAAIRKLTSATGFEYTFLPDRNEFAHAPVFVVCTPEGRISRYLYGVEIEPQLMRLSIVEAGKGKVGSSMDQIILWCFNYDPDSNSYVLQALNLMKLAGAATVAIIVAICIPFWFTRPGKRTKADRAKLTANDPADESSGSDEVNNENDSNSG